VHFNHDSQNSISVHHDSQTSKIVDHGFTKISLPSTYPPPPPPFATRFKLFSFVFVTNGKDGRGLKLESKLTKLPVFHM